MQIFEIRKYQPTMKALWDSVVSSAANATFMHYRDFMEYHAHRFEDSSLLMFKGDEAVAAFPANIAQKTVFSHQGLSYAGLLVLPSLSAEDIMACTRQIIRYFSMRGFETLHWKKTPDIYHEPAVFAEEISLFSLGGRMQKMELNAVVPLKQPLSLQQRRKRGSKKALRLGVKLVENAHWESFWEMLTANLAERHGVQPTHSLSEIKKLVSNFPHHISLHAALLDGQLVGGTVLFRKKQVVHAQYIASSPLGREVGALDLLFGKLLLKYQQADFQYFSLGVSTDLNRGGINKGLLAWKESWGAIGKLHLQYTVPLTNQYTEN